MEAAVGCRIIEEIEESSLYESLESLPPPPFTNLAGTGYPSGREPASRPSAVIPFPGLRSIVARHSRAGRSPMLSVSGRALPLLYVLTAALISPPYQQAVVIIDLEGRFDVTRVLQRVPVTPNSALTPEDAVDSLAHIHIWRLTPSTHSSAADISRAIDSARDHMLYSLHSSRGRKWWGTIVIGNIPIGNSVALATGPTGWLRVQRTGIDDFGVATNPVEALLKKKKGKVEGVSDESGKCRWLASSAWGDFSFAED